MKVKYPIQRSEFSGLWKHQNNPACTETAVKPKVSEFSEC